VISINPAGKAASAGSRATPRVIPTREDRVDRIGGGHRLGTFSCVCPRCGGSQLAAAEGDLDPQARCHACDAALPGGAPACAACGRSRCGACDQAQAVCVPHLPSMGDGFTLRCARCGAATTSLCIC
jgi:hypothetical protein